MSQQIKIGSEWCDVVAVYPTVNGGEMYVYAVDAVFNVSFSPHRTLRPAPAPATKGDEMTDEARQFVSATMNQSQLALNVSVSLFRHYGRCARDEFRSGNYRTAWHDFKFSIYWLWAAWIEIGCDTGFPTPRQLRITGKGKAITSR